jgi:hypothetical protein
MKDPYLNIIPNIYLVRETKEIKKIRNEYILTKRNSFTKKEILEKIVNTTYNRKWPNGKIHSLSKNGEYVSHSVTPYAKDFLDNIEDGIKPLVIALKDKGYLSISSCEGHNLWDRRFVVLIFPSKKEAISFQNKMPFNVTSEIKHHTEFLNTRLSVDGYGQILNAEKKEFKKDPNESLDYINTFTKRNYADAWFLELIIIDKIEYTDGFWKYIKNIKYILFRKFFLKFYTKCITDYVLSDSMPSNIY